MIVLAVVIAALLVERFVAQRNHDRQITHLQHALVARTASELVGLESAHHAKPREKRDREPMVEQVGA